MNRKKLSDEYLKHVNGGWQARGYIYAMPRAERHAFAQGFIDSFRTLF
ncbi:hypothetical protein LCR01_09700 [Companilactobacillus crustorum]|uniref:Uma2 family endonuclease n=1 Tax=Companilactobacillus crustorum TaxID=392416 RepID=A0AB34ACG1_9LACO|nr:hypothetical protein [Companilactobacillus crustorum]APU70538.1 hypothetical protein BI355_0181 [Companilactobacillus crustorum]WDT65307.1 hypothetical protein NV391_10100 [Companilactobacillus crustorum]GEO76527.1 hypothetical protein LCR01_09700 [Companilactobacillus crustorum]